MCRLKKAAKGFFLVVFALLAVSPAVFLLAGTFMGNQEIYFFCVYYVPFFCRDS